MLKKLISLIPLFTLLVMVQPAFAGGPLVSLSADPSGWVSDAGYGTVIRFYLNTSSFPCKDSQVTFKFTDSQEGDYIMTSSGTSTYTIQDDGSKGCNTYAKMASKKSGTRMVTAVVKNGDRTMVDPYVPIIKVDFDGQYHPDSSYNDYNYRSSTNNPYSFLYATPTPTATKLTTIPSNLRITQVETTGDPNMRNVHIMWDPIPEATAYNIYKNAGSSYYYFTTVDANLYEMKVNIGSTFYVAVTAKKDGLESPYSDTVTIDLANSKYVPPATISNTITAWVLNQQLDNNKRQVTLKWSAFDGNPGTFSVLAKSETNKTNWDKIAWEQRGPSVTVNIPNEDYYLKMYGCADKYGDCSESNILSLPKITIENGTVVVPSVVPVTSNTKIGELNKKVSDLENKLAESQKKQSVLEERLNGLISWIRSHIPFFR